MFRPSEEMLADGRALRERVRLAVPEPEPGFSLVVDLAEDLFSRDWWRGAATLTAVVAVLLVTAPRFDPLPQPAETSRDASGAMQLRVAGVAPLRQGGQSGMRMVAGETVEPLAEVPERPYRDLVATVGAQGGLLASLKRAGVAPRDAEAAQAAVAAVAPAPIAPGTKVGIRLGRAGSSGSRPLETLSLKARYDMNVSLRREGDIFSVSKQRIAVASAPMRIRGTVDSGLYWSLRAAGASPRAASDYLKALGAKIDVGEVAAGDRFDLVLERRTTDAGEELAGPLLYASVDRQGASDLSLLKWRVGDKEQWIDPLGTEMAEESGLSWPVSAPISSGYGMRRHPILRYMRMHRGIDFRARSGTPVYAASDGIVTRAGWAGGYGRQVRLAHEGGLGTSYSHLSRIAVPDGSAVTRGQLIGYSGSSGLSTGPHLHYEVYQNGRAVDPNSVRLVRRPLVDPRTLELVKARQRDYLKLAPAAPPPAPTV